MTKSELGHTDNYKKGLSSQKSIKIDGDLWDELDHWIKKPKAQKLGFHSKADFATQAVREMLEKYSMENKAYEKFLRTYNKHSSFLRHNKIEDPISFANYVDKILELKS